jgi:AcrR family transcriptional regulator
MINLTKRQKEIVAAGLTNIANKGIQSLLIRNVVNRIGISESADYRHFENKNDLPLCITHYIIEDWENAISRHASVDIPVLDELGLLMQDIVPSFAEDENVAASAYSLQLIQKDKSILQKIRSIIELALVEADGIPDKEQEAGDIRPDFTEIELAMIIFGTLHRLIERWNLTNNGFDIKAEWDLLRFALKKMIGTNQ